MTHVDYMTTPDIPAITVDGVSFTYSDEPVLDNVSFQVAPQTLCALVGPNGGGKSTLIKCITGLLSPGEGSINVHCAHDHTSHSIGYVAQRHFISNDFPVSVYEAVSTGRVVGQKRWLRLKKHDHEVIMHSIESVGLHNHARCSLNELSGGQQQRVLIAKALASEPDVMILDEPTAGVDSASQKLFRDALHHIISEHATTVLLVSHELTAVSDLVNQVVVLKNKILFDGTPTELSSQGVSLGIHEHDLPAWVERVQDHSFHKDAQ